jgi:signal peptidase II
MIPSKKMAIILFILFSCIGSDQVTKAIARQSLTGIEPIRMFNDTFRLQYAENPGAFLSFGANIPENIRYWLLTVLIGIFLVIMLYYLIKSRKINRPNTIALSIILGGGFGNLIDRIFNDGRVIDFLNLGIGTFRTGIFNVADIAITLGVFWLAILSITNSYNNKTNHGN